VKALLHGRTVLFAPCINLYQEVPFKTHHDLPPLLAWISSMLFTSGTQTAKTAAARMFALECPMKTT
jgi:hypothetical protein